MRQGVWMEFLQGEHLDDECDHCGAFGVTEDRPPRGYLCEDCCLTIDAAGESEAQGLLKLGAANGSD